MARPWNFSAGPSALPESVLQQAAAEMLDWHGSGMSVMEMSHRGRQFVQICDEAEADLRELMNVPADYAIMFMQGGGLGENAIVPMNLIGRRGLPAADFVVTGHWSTRSHKEAGRYGDAQIAASSAQAVNIDGHEQRPFTWVPPLSDWRVRPEAAYLHLCSNETIGGVEFTEWPDLAAFGAPDVPLVVDASSHFLSRPLDVTRTGLLFAGAQKNAGPAGVTVVIARRDLLGKALSICPSAFDYANVAAEHSRYNTPPTFAIYVAGLVYKWVKAQGGVQGLEAANKAKADLLYGYLDASGFYRNPVHPAVRSRMNVPFVLHDESLNDAFLKGAEAAGLLALKGHKSVGGMRASIYNAMPLAGVQALVDYLKEFERLHG
ncbi:3-phosphoserine/phosphohydroxythreonine transaminase [Bordetella avium]|uniref:Phosphoserine aminotransferase n=1 Tax=Bordetella avium (strain 197N) TaxID=360910 RepID=SERC_BORA1|nr:3-phosphoserine/phosphohydroxythreonine transaminase [Bordetella avium]Q2L2T1.1 RecName: Full=Phosphoserine aminotransferase; AltName: Full=Phosphohydroxythreonine aminotransferase; Short=PSAT [Bordetella avium 197N]AZY48761.1 phosphoserine aminotransferase [Bordetella avium]AZY52139.1 phosphoserine aminotransferase [Bordetella avium]RIQ14066.1 3-phosphoserine/phosphohydroxythreonine transaminase [Bordetella avium]RIQ17939.1 3-phosphoserine/phosphohydroxythreonine transaminase [Bordetella a